MVGYDVQSAVDTKHHLIVGMSRASSKGPRPTPDRRLHAAEEFADPACYPAAASISCGAAVRPGRTSPCLLCGGSPANLRKASAI